jgi:hypothetical protein
MLVTTSRSDSEASDTKETAGISWDDHKNKPSSCSIIILISKSAPTDIGYILYITNQYSLFNSEVKLCRRSIQIRGRRFYSEGIGTIVIKLVNKRFIFLENNLFVPKLGYILVLAKKLVRNKFIG